MIVVRFKVKCQPGKSEQAMAAFREVVEKSRPLAGVVSFDVGWDVVDSDAFVATEVFADREALGRQEALPCVQKTIALLGSIVAAAPEATLFHVASSEPHGG
ncbi:MAG: antibiotic biosynthesis monooxygenase [Myxococcales bacterium]|nr:antibiotic biosynthesis monooxygenase [Myxococcales bacterium]